MLENNNAITAFNNFDEMPLFPYRIIEHLIKAKGEHAQMFWKLLEYQTIDALDKDDLTIQQKKAMIWDGIDTREENFNIFLKSLLGNSLDSAEQQTRVHIYRYDTTPINRLRATIIYEIDLIAQEKCANVLYNGVLCERLDLIESCLLNLINGAYIGGVGELMFDRTLSRTCKSLIGISNSKSFYGRSLFLGLTLLSADTDGNVCA